MQQLYPKQAAVIVLYEQSQDALVLTQRSPQLKNHPGEICFPGGGMQAGDIDFYHTALRELQEELGIDSDRIQTPVAMKTEHTLTGFTIYPWFAQIEQLIPYQADSQEVAEVFTLPMKEVRTAENYRMIRIASKTRMIETLQYCADQRFIWGATARIMQQLVFCK